MLSHLKSQIGHTRNWSTKIEVYTRTLGQRAIGMGSGMMMMIMTHSGTNGGDDDDGDYDTFRQQCWGYRQDNMSNDPWVISDGRTVFSGQPGRFS